MPTQNSIGYNIERGGAAESFWDAIKVVEHGQGKNRRQLIMTMKTPVFHPKSFNFICKSVW